MKSFIVSLFIYGMYAVSIATIILGLVTIFVPVQFSVAIGSILTCVGISTLLQIKKTLG